MPQLTKAAIAGLADECGPRVFRAAYRLLKDPILAEDVLQEVFLKLLRQPRQFDGVKNWPAYLTTMGTSLAIDLLRQRRHQLLAEEYQDRQPAPDGQTAEPPGPMQALSVSRDLEKLRAALTRLSQLECQVFCLRHLEEFSYKEIAAQLDISVNLVGVTLNRAQSRLSEQLTESQFLGAVYEIN